MAYKCTHLAHARLGKPEKATEQDNWYNARTFITFVNLFLCACASELVVWPWAVNAVLVSEAFITCFVCLFIPIHVYLYLSTSTNIRQYVSISIYIYQYLSISDYIYRYLSISPIFINIYRYLMISINIS